MFDTIRRHALHATLLMTIAALLQSAPALAQPGVVRLQSGHSTLMHIAGITRVAIGDGRIAGVVPLGTTQLIINGKEPGTTSLFVWAGGTRRTYVVSVTDAFLDNFAQMIQGALNNPGIRVTSYGANILISGTVPDMAQWVNQNNIVQSFMLIAKEQKYHIVDAVAVTQSLDSLQQDFARSPTAHDLRMEPDGKGDIIVSGYVRDQVEEEQVIARAKTLAGPYLAVDGKVIDRLELMHTSQISIRVYVLEIDRTGLGDIGLQLQSGVPDPSNPNAISLEPPIFPIVEGAAAGLLGKALNLAPFFRTVRLVPTLNLVLSSGHARMLSAPNLVTVPGSQATFLVGGEIPYVFSTGIGQTSVDWKNYGVQLNVTPTLLPNGSVESNITPDISNLDFQDAVQLNGFFIPALKESRLSTDIITQPGESIIMGGLLNRVNQRTISKIPILSSIPILGRLFQSTNYQNSETDVVFILTPEIVTQ
ncbi:MAG TPA: pilus assembly protein N-terminal domain-containing protein [Candidatus Tyrphobacter sp.]